MMRGGELVCTELTPPFESAFARELVHFHECIAYGRRPFTDARDSRCDLEVLHAIAAAFR
jgi:hypothetical protein